MRLIYLCAVDKPRMLKNLQQLQPLCRIVTQQLQYNECVAFHLLYLADKVASAVGNIVGKAEVDFDDAAIRLLVALGLKWWTSHQEFVAQYSQRPQVNLRILGFAIF